MRVEHTIDACMLTMGGIWSLANLEHILGIVLLVIQILWLSVKCIVKIYNNIKAKKNPNVENEAKTIFENIKILINKIVNREKDNTNDREN